VGIAAAQLAGEDFLVGLDRTTGVLTGPRAASAKVPTTDRRSTTGP
jgi:hypothetical protein